MDALVIPKEFIKPLPNYATKEVAEFIDKVSRASVNLFSQKDVDYNGSWQNKGILSVQMNFERKVDRINAQFYNGTMVSSKGENIADTLIDASTYSLMYTFFLYKNDPNVKKQVDEFLSKYK